MKLRILFLFGWTAWFAPAQEPSCHPVEGDRILARDLAAVLPEFGSVQPDALLGQAPLPAAQRTFHSPELHALAHRFGIVLSPADDICFEWSFAAAGPQPARSRPCGSRCEFPTRKSKLRSWLRSACPRAASNSRSTGWGCLPRRVRALPYFGGGTSCMETATGSPSGRVWKLPCPAAGWWRLRV